MEAQQQVPEHLPGVELEFRLLLIVLIGRLDDIVQVVEDGIVGRSHLREVRLVGNSPALVQPLDHQLQGVDVRRVEVLIDPEDVPQEGDVLGQEGPVKGRGLLRVIRIAPVVPPSGLQQVDAVLAAEEVQEAAAQVSAQLLHLMLRVQGNDRFSRQSHVAQQELQQETLALAGVAQDDSAAVGLVRGPPVQVQNNVGSVLIPANVKSPGVGLAGVADGVQIGRAGGGEHPLSKGAEGILSRRIDGKKPLPLTQEQRVRGELGAEEDSLNRVLQAPQPVQRFGRELQKYRAVDQRLLIPAQAPDEFFRVLELGLRRDALLHVV